MKFFEKKYEETNQVQIHKFKSLDFNSESADP